MKKRLALLAAACLCMAVSMTSFAADKSDIVVAVDADVDTLHPTDFSTTVELGVLNQIYDTLLYYSPDGTKDPEPRIAESYEISDDGLDYTFHLRDDVTFHDGTPVTADDVVFSIEDSDVVPVTAAIPLPLLYWVNAMPKPLDFFKEDDDEQNCCLCEKKN